MDCRSSPRVTPRAWQAMDQLTGHALVRLMSLEDGEIERWRWLPKAGVGATQTRRPELSSKQVS